MNKEITHQSFFLKAGPLFLILLLDGMGLSLVFPILNALISDPSTGFLSNNNSLLWHNLIYGFTIAIFMLCWFFGATILGDLSDQIGRKKSLLVCLIGAFLGYLISGIGVDAHSLFLLILGRVIAGFTSGSQPIAQAAIIDLSTPENKTRNISWILLSLSLGFVIGPLMGGVLADKSLISWFGFATPFYFAAGISFLNVILLQVLFSETHIRKGKINIKFKHAVDLFVAAFQHPTIRYLSFVFLIFIIGWSSFYSFIALFLLKKYSLDSTQISLMMAVMGVGFGIGNGILVDYFTKRFPLKNIAVLSLLTSAAVIFIMIIAQNLLVMWLLMAPIAASVAVAFSVLLTLFSNRVDADSQGWIMGVTGSIMALVFALDAILGGLLAEFGVMLPMILAVIGLTLASILMNLEKRKQEIVSIQE